MCDCVYKKVCELREDTWGNVCPLNILGEKAMDDYLMRYFGEKIEKGDKKDDKR